MTAGSLSLATAALEGLEGDCNVEELDPDCRMFRRFKVILLELSVLADRLTIRVGVAGKVGSANSTPFTAGEESATGIFVGGLSDSLRCRFREED